MNHPHIPLIKNFCCLHENSSNSKSAHVYCLKTTPIEKRIYLTSIWDQQFRTLPNCLILQKLWHVIFRYFTRQLNVSLIFNFQLQYLHKTNITFTFCTNHLVLCVLWLRLKLFTTHMKVAATKNICDSGKVAEFCQRSFCQFW